MYSEALLASGWTLKADELPERLTPEPRQNSFILPGASALADFADLLGLHTTYVTRLLSSLLRIVILHQYSLLSHRL